MARQRERDILVTLAALAATALLVVLFQGGNNLAPQSPQEVDDSSLRVRRSNDQDAIDIELGIQTCGDDEEYIVGCVEEGACCRWRGKAGDGEEIDISRAGKKRRKKNKKPKLTDPRDIYNEFASRNQASASAAMKGYNKAVINSPENMLAGADPAVLEDLGTVSTTKNTFLDGLNQDSGVNCKSGEASVSFKTKQVVIAWPTTYDVMSVDKAATHSRYIDFANNLYNKIKAQSRTKVYFAPYQMQATRSKEMKKDLTADDVPFSDNQNIQNPSWLKLFSKIYNSFIKKYVGTAGGQIKTQSATSSKSCFMIFLVHEIPKDYINMMRRDSQYQAFYTYSQICTVIPVFVKPDSMTNTIFESLVPVLVPGTNEAQVYDNEFKGYYTVSGGEDGPSASDFNDVADDIMSYMCMAETHVFCNRLYPAWVDAGEVKAIEEEVAVPTAAATEGTTTEGTTTEEPEPTERTTTEEIFYESTAAVAVDDSCCGCQPYLSEKFNQNEKICCKLEDGSFVIKANFEVCEFNQN